MTPCCEAKAIHTKGFRTGAFAAKLRWILFARLRQSAALFVGLLHLTLVTPAETPSSTAVIFHPAFANSFAPSVASASILGSFIQQYGASQFPSNPVEPLLITSVSFRLDESRTSANIPVEGIRIAMATAQYSLFEMVDDPGSNLGGDYVSVYQAQNIRLIAEGSPDVNQFGFHFSFERPFVYNPGAGDLVMHLVARTGGSVPWDMGDASPLATRHIPGLVSASVLPGGLVTKFEYTVVPEPAPAYLLWFGIGLIALVQKWRLRHESV